MIRLVAAFLSCLSFAGAAAAFECHTALALALDASASVDEHEARLQRRGIAAALRDPDVVAALAPGEGFGALMMVFEWADPGEFEIIADWTRLDGPSSVDRLAAQVDRPPRVTLNGQTGIGAALAFAAEAHAQAPANCGRRVIDVSGDGPGNIGEAPRVFREAGVFDGLVINGLVIRDVVEDYALQQPTRDPLPYYEREVRYGPGAFIVVTETYKDYAQAMREKLLKELQPSLAGVMR